MKYWALILHFYQPPTQSAAITSEILQSCYLPLLRMLNKKSGWKCTFNLSGSLLEQLYKLRADEFFELVKQLVKDGKVELTDSYMYHSLSPRTPAHVLERAIKKNKEIIFKTLGVHTSGGFFPPELAIDTKSLNHISAQYVIVDGSAIDEYPIAKFKNTYLLVSNREMTEVFRSYPKKLDAKKLLTYALEKTEDGSLMILPSDVEVFGHHFQERLEFLSQFLDSKKVKFITAAEAVKQFGQRAPEVQSVRLSSWQNTTRLAMWTGNSLQKQYLNLAIRATDLVGDNADEGVLAQLDKGWSSCYLFWLSNSPWWYPDLVEQGAYSLIKSVRSTFVDQKEKQKVEKLYFRFMKNVWLYHWSVNVEKGFRRHDKVRAKMQKNLPDL